MSRDRQMLEAGLELAMAIRARAVITFVAEAPCGSHPMPVLHAGELALGPGATTLEGLHDVLLERLAKASGAVALDDGTAREIVGVFPDGLVVLDLERVRSRFDLAQFDAAAPRGVMVAALRLALEIGREGREGKAVGTAFIVGDGDAILAVSHQLILNPYLGHPSEVTTILSRENWESVKEFAQLDGMFVVDRSGAVIAAGRYLDVDSKSVSLPSGLGGRHRAAAAITTLLPVVAVIISESGGTVRVFQGGNCRIEIRPDLGVVQGCA